MARVVVTGGMGFIGSHLVDALLAQGNEVGVVDNLSTGDQNNLTQARAAGDTRLTIRELDICSPEAKSFIVEYKPEVIFHLAAQMNVRASVADPQFDATKNVVGTVNMIESAKGAGTKSFILASTGGAIYGEQSYFPADEKHPIHPECPYGVSKRCGELYLEYFARAAGLRCVALRFANVFGPRQNPKGEAGVVAIFSERLFRGDTLKINGSGEQTRDFVFVSDVVEANLRVAAGTTPGFHIYNVGTGVETSVLDLVREMERLWPTIRRDSEPATVSIQNGPALAGEQQRSVIANTRIASEFGWKPAVSFVDGLRQTVESFRPLN